MEWIRTSYLLPPEGERVMTKIEDRDGTRNEQKMHRQKNLWFTADGMYVYYTPTHWAYIGWRE